MLIKKLNNVKPDSAAAWLHHLWPDPPPGFLLLWLMRGKRSLWFPTGDLQALAEAAEQHALSGDVYLGCGLSPKDFGEDKRCESAAVSAIPGLWGDIDVAGPPHKKKKLPPDLDSALSLARAMPLPPSVLIYSGHGLQPWWLLSKPWVFGTDGDRAEAAAEVADWNAHLQRLASGRGWSVDSTHDLARILRVPGTFNHKGKGEPVAVRLEIAEALRRYDPAELRAALLEAQPQAAHGSKGKSGSRLTAKARGGTCPLPLDDAEQALWHRLGADTRGKISALWAGEISAYDDDDSRADCALCKYLLILTNGDRTRAEQLFNESALGRRDKWTGRQDYRNRTFDKAAEGLIPWHDDAIRNGPPRHSAAPMPTGKTVALGDLALEVGTARRKPSGRLSVPLTAWKGSVIVYHALLSDAAYALADASRRLVALAGGPDRAEAEAALVTVLAQAEASLRAEPVEAAGPTVAEIVADLVPKELDLLHRTGRGAWSEARGGEIARADFLAFTPGWLIEAASKASDAAPRRAEVLRQVEAELRILWASLVPGLPPAHEAEAGADTEAARQFRSAMVRLWTATRTFEVCKGEEGVAAKRASLASRVIARKDAIGDSPTAFGKWHEVQSSFDAWWRKWTDAGGEIRTALGMRWTLAAQVGVELPSVTSQVSLTGLSDSYGVTDPAPPFPVRCTGGGRLAVLSADITDEILEKPPENDAPVTQ
jgi:hypothetical protein